MISEIGPASPARLLVRALEDILAHNCGNTAWAYMNMAKSVPVDVKKLLESCTGATLGKRHLNMAKSIPNDVKKLLRVLPREKFGKRYAEQRDDRWVVDG